VIAHNTTTAGRWGGGISSYITGAYPFKIENCTIVSNRLVNLTSTYNGGVYMYGSGAGIPSTISNVINCIICYNDNQQVKYAAGCTTALVSCCVIYGSGETVYPNPGGTTADPLLVSIASNDFRLSSAQSSCYNHGANLAWMDNSLDLGGHSRKDRFSGIVDIGAYEFIPAGTVIQVW